MKKCWDEKFEKRPEFSSLVHSVGNMLTDSFTKVGHFIHASRCWMDSSSNVLALPLFLNITRKLTHNYSGNSKHTVCLTLFFCPWMIEIQPSLRQLPEEWPSGCRPHQTQTLLALSNCPPSIWPSFSHHSCFFSSSPAPLQPAGPEAWGL